MKYFASSALTVKVSLFSFPSSRSASSSLIFFSVIFLALRSFLSCVLSSSHSSKTKPVFGVTVKSMVVGRSTTTALNSTPFLFAGSVVAESTGARFAVISSPLTSILPEENTFSVSMLLLCGLSYVPRTRISAVFSPEFGEQATASVKIKAASMIIIFLIFTLSPLCQNKVWR